MSLKKDLGVKNGEVKTYTAKLHSVEGSVVQKTGMGIFYEEKDLGEKLSWGKRSDEEMQSEKITYSEKNRGLRQVEKT